MRPSCVPRTFICLIFFSSFGVGVPRLYTKVKQSFLTTAAGDCPNVASPAPPSNLTLSYFFFCHHATPKQVWPPTIVRPSFPFPSVFPILKVFLFNKLNPPHSVFSFFLLSFPILSPKNTLWRRYFRSTLLPIRNPLLLVFLFRGCFLPF